MPRNAAFVYEDALSVHTLSETHPMKPVRLRYTYELLDAYEAFGRSNVQLARPRPASDEEILTFHSREYVEAVRALSRDDTTVDAARFNIGPGDNPSYPGMFEAAQLSTGASLKAVELLMDGHADVAFSISGGLHHAMPDYAHGFCVFNDPVIAIKAMVAGGMRVAYVDIDCHHGDGVQYAFYDSDAVLTVSLHESGAFLFPGTGFTQEVGAGRGRGFSVNVPLYPYTSDEVYAWAFEEVVPPLLQAFRPDVLVTQLGIDSHYLDPITHMALTAQGHNHVVARLADLAPDRWLALGGGGYDVQAVARAWTLDFAVMSEQVLEGEIPPSYRERYAVDRLQDPGDLPIGDATVKDTRAFAESSVQAVQRLIFPNLGIASV